MSRQVAASLGAGAELTQASDGNCPPPRAASYRLGPMFAMYAGGSTISSGLGQFGGSANRIGQPQGRNGVLFQRAVDPRLAPLCRAHAAEHAVPAQDHVRKAVREQVQLVAQVVVTGAVNREQPRAGKHPLQAERTAYRRAVQRQHRRQRLHYRERIEVPSSLSDYGYKRNFIGGLLNI